jgi:hypothetical protein
MKTIVLAAAGLMALSTTALAQSGEQQTYSIYGSARPNFQQQENAQMNNYAESQQVGTRRIYPGREAYGRDFGPLTRHPGDYRDAVDRGQWPAGGNVGSRNFSIE